MSEQAKALVAMWRSLSQGASSVMDAEEVFDRCADELEAALSAPAQVGEAVAWARPIIADERGPEGSEPGDLVDIEFHCRRERPEGAVWKPLVTQPVNRAEVKRTSCRCHPETCCCGDYELFLDGQCVADGGRESMQRIADAINRAAPPAPSAADPVCRCPQCGESFKAGFTAGLGEAGITPMGSAMFDRIAELREQAARNEATTPTEDKGGAWPDDERKEAEQAYTISAFDYERNPVGSGEWMLFWKGWQARAALAAAAPQAPVGGECGDGCADKAGCRLADESPHAPVNRNLQPQEGDALYLLSLAANIRDVFGESSVVHELRRIGLSMDAAPPALTQPVDDRILELAKRLVGPGPKCSHLSASECHEISEFIFSITQPAPSSGEASA